MSNTNPVLYPVQLAIKVLSGRGREPPDAMSLRYADTSLPELLSRPSLRFAEMSMRKHIKMCLCNTGGF